MIHRLLPSREQCRSCWRFRRSAVMYVASDGVRWPFNRRFSTTKSSREPLETIMLYWPSESVRGGDLVHVALLLKIQTPDLTFSLVTNELSHLDGAANQGPLIALNLRRAGTQPDDGARSGIACRLKVYLTH